MSLFSPQWEELLKETKPVSLPDKIVIDILSRLPVKSITRFRCACKAWNELFSDPEFIKMHLNRATANGDYCFLVKHTPGLTEEKKLKRKSSESTIIQAWNPMPGTVWRGNHEEIYSFRRRQTFEEFDKLEAIKPGNYHAIVGSFNGIVCLVESTSVTVRTRPGLRTSIWNPATRELKKLPELSNPSEIEGLGFAYIEELNEYKVVAVIQSRKSSRFRGLMYSLSTNEWRKFRTKISLVIHDPISHAYLNRKLHWLARGSDHRYFILSLEVEEENFNKIWIPDAYFPMDFVAICQSPACLGEPSVMVFNTSDRFEGCDVWVMKEYGTEQSWTKLYHIPHTKVSMTPYEFFENGDVIMSHDDVGELFSFSSTESAYTKLNVFAPARVVKYTESLISIGGTCTESDRCRKNSGRKKARTFVMYGRWQWM